MTSPVQAMQAVQAVAGSLLWDSGAADYLLGVPVIESLQQMRALLAGNAICLQGVLSSTC